MEIVDAFEIILPDIRMEVNSYLIKSMRLFRISFSDGRPPLNVTLVEGSKPFWTSVPQGRQIEAEFFGARIAEKIKTQ